MPSRFEVGSPMRSQPVFLLFPLCSAREAVSVIRQDSTEPLFLAPRASDCHPVFSPLFDPFSSVHHPWTGPLPLRFLFPPRAPRRSACRSRKIHPHRSLARSDRRHSTAGGRDVSRQYVSHFDRNTPAWPSPGGNREGAGAGRG